MKNQKIVVTGDAYFLYRYQFLFKAMSPYFAHLEYISSKNVFLEKVTNVLIKAFYGITYIFSPNSMLWHERFNIRRLLKSYSKNKASFVMKSQQTERKIRKLEYVPDFIFHVFGLYSPLWNKIDIPYAMYLDYTMALAKKNWPSWTPYTNYREYESWIDCEQEAYRRAHHLFPMSNVVKTSLMEDYGIEAHKITVVGSSGNFLEPHEGEKLFGSKQILFNGSDFERKGGDLVVAAFKKVKQTLPEARLIIIGKKLSIHEDGIDNPGKISSTSDMRDLFLKTDLVVAPSYCEPFQQFLLEAMNYGVPCIVSSNDGMPEIIEHGVDGIVIEQPTADILANHIINLLGDISILKTMSQNARRKVKTKFNWNEIAKNILQALSTSHPF